jgi:hypothetical protein
MKNLRFMRSLFQLLVATVCLGTYSIADANDFGLIVNSPPIEVITESHLAHTEFQLNIFDGGALQIRDGIRKGGGFSEVNLLGGTADVRVFGPDVVLNMSGGTLSTRGLSGRANVSGGVVEDLVAIDGSLVRIVGGSVGEGFQARGGSNVSLVGLDFEIDGEPIVGLMPSVPMEISVRDVELTGMFADNSPFELVLGSDSFSSDATLSVTLVPEPSSYTVVFIASAAWFRLTRKSRKR